MEVFTMAISLITSFASSSAISGQNSSNDSFQKLASGSKINSASDDAAGLAIAEKLTSKLGGFDVAIRNANDSISAIQVADGALQSLNNNLSRIQELTLQAGNGALNSQDRKALQAEADQLIDESNQLLENTNFNGKSLLNNDEGLSVQLDEPGKNIQLEGKNLAKEFKELGFDDVDLTSQSAANKSLETLNKASELVLSRQSELGAVSNRVENSIDNISSSRINAAQARSRISDTDYAKVASDLAASQVRDQAQIAVQAQANGQRSAVLQLLS
ncbi:MAG: flagellin [Oleiphilaceae bacterium]|jgi:flagellin